MAKMKRLSAVWGIVVVLMFAALLIYGLMFTKQNENYKEIEAKLENLAEKKVEEDGAYNEIKRGDIKYKSSDLTDEILKYKSDECSGYVIVHYNGMVYEYDAYIKCDHYETRNYE